MSLINITNVCVLSNPSPFSSPFSFEITFDCQAPGLPDDSSQELEWKLLYVSSAEDENLDQVLDSVLVGPVSLGANKFVFDCPPPDVTQIPQTDLMEVTVILLTCSYRDVEFVRIGYYVNNDYPLSEVALKDERQAWLNECDRIKAQEQEYKNQQAEAQHQAQTLLEQKSLTDAASTINGDAQPAAAAVAAVNTSGDMEMGNSRDGVVNSNATPAQSTTANTTSLSSSTTTAPSFTLPPQPKVMIDKLYREILADKPRVTRFAIDWNSEAMRAQLAAQRALQQAQTANGQSSSSSSSGNAGEFEMTAADRAQAERAARDVEAQSAQAPNARQMQQQQQSSNATNGDDNDSDMESVSSTSSRDDDESDDSDSSELAEVYELVDAKDDDEDDEKLEDSKENRNTSNNQQSTFSSSSTGKQPQSSSSNQSKQTQQLPSVQQLQHQASSNSMMD